MPRETNGETAAAKIDEAREKWGEAYTITAGEPSNAVGVSLADFHAYMPMHNYIFAPTREMWPAASVNARIPPVGSGSEKINPNLWLDQNNAVEQMTWAPGLPMIILDRLISEGGWIDRNDVRCFNLYRPPTIIPGDAGEAGRWLDHINRVFADDAEHLIHGWPTGCSIRKRRSTMPSCLAAVRVSARTRSSSP
jgi:hypothetical protein